MKNKNITFQNKEKLNKNRMLILESTYFDKLKTLNNLSRVSDLVKNDNFNNRKKRH